MNTKNNIKVDIKAKALYFLSRREYAYRELFIKLQKYTQDLEEIKAVLKDLQNKDWLSEERYISRYLECKSTKYGVAKVKYNLICKTGNYDLVEQIITSSDIDEYQNAYKLWYKKFGEVATDFVSAQKQIRFLYNKGFSLDIIKKIVSGKFLDDE